VTPIQRFRLSLLLFFLLIGGGTLGYVEIEGWGWVDSLFMTVITLSTVGYQTVHPLDRAGLFFTMALIVVGVGTLGYAIATLSETILEGHLQSFWGGRKMERMIEKLENHVIVCGFGRIGSLTAAALAGRDIPFVVVEENPDLVKEIVGKKFLVVMGNATEEGVLRKAGIDRAQALLVTLSTRVADAAYIVMSSRIDHPGLTIIAMANDSRTEAKLLKAGANKVVSPFILGSNRMVMALTQPTLLDVMDVVTTRDGMGLTFEELVVPEISPFCDLSIAEIGKKFGIRSHIIAIRPAGGKNFVLPTAQSVLRAMDQIVMIGSRDEFERIRAIMAGEPEAGVRT
jgi:voltage-gated potassium channel